jgi:excisionase family DNA binding protein
VEAAQYLGISRAKMYEMIASKEIGSITIGRSRRVPLSALHDYVVGRLAAAQADSDAS